MANLARLVRYLLIVCGVSLAVTCIRLVHFVLDSGPDKVQLGQDPAEQSVLNDVINGLANVSYPPFTNVSFTDVSPAHGDSDNNVTLLALVTYQRTGSSFLGELFNRNPDAFVWFEPLDGVFSALYGTAYGYNVPADIWNNPDGSERLLPRAEQELVARTSAAILTCDFEQLPTEVLLHHFVLMFLDQHQRLAPYAKCIQDGKDGLTKCRDCNTKLAKTCTHKFNGQDRVSQMCANELASQHISLVPDMTPPFPGVVASANVKAAVETYVKCMVPCRKRALGCTDHLKRPCLMSTIRSIKPVRLNMEASRILKKIVPNVKLLHNLRDPRGVVHSRKHTSESFQSTYAIIPKKSLTQTVKSKSGKYVKKEVKVTDINPAKEARLFCRNAAKDSQMRKEIEKVWPGSTHQVVYEHYAAHPQEAAHQIYNFISKPLPSQVTQWLKDNTDGAKVHPNQQTSRQANVTLLKWQGEFTVEVMRNIDLECTQLYEELNHTWPYS